MTKLRKNNLRFFVTTRQHGVEEVPGLIEMISISFPELPKPSRAPENNEKTHVIQNPNVCQKTSGRIFIILSKPCATKAGKVYHFAGRRRVWQTCGEMYLYVYTHIHIYMYMCSVYI